MPAAAAVAALALVAGVGLGIGSANAAPPAGGDVFPRAAKYLGATIYTLDPGEDRDRDFLKDARENVLAQHFRPYLIFDRYEAHTRPWEPVTLIQVRPLGCVGLGCPGDQRIWIKYAFLWTTDGGYGESSDCSDAHNGDNQSMNVVLTSSDQGHTWRINVQSDVVIGDEHYRSSLLPTLWPGQGSAEVKLPYVFFSSHKHHQYGSTWNNERDSIYSDYGCNDDVDGNGAHRYACITASCTDPALAGVFNNVGEPEAHDPAYFTGDLSRWYPGENAWSTKEFKGGLNDDDKDTSSLRSMWESHAFSPSASWWSVLMQAL